MSALKTPPPACPADAYAGIRHDEVRSRLEVPALGHALDRLFDLAPGSRVLDLGCGDGLVARLGGRRISRYLGLDLIGSGFDGPADDFRAHDLGIALGVDDEAPFDLYIGTFGVASHLHPDRLGELVTEIAEHARAGAIVALEALGLNSLEWPGLWESDPGEGRLLRYMLSGPTCVHPWSPTEVGELYGAAGIEWIGARDLTIQTGPKAGPEGYWPGLPPLRDAMTALLDTDDGAPEDPLLAELPPLPAHPAARFHHGLAARRHDVLRRARATGLGGSDLAQAVWRLDPPKSAGYGHRLLVVGRVA